MSGIAVPHAYDGYSRRENFDGSLVHTILMYSPDGTNFYDSAELGLYLAFLFTVVNTSGLRSVNLLSNEYMMIMMMTMMIVQEFGSLKR